MQCVHGKKEGAFQRAPFFNASALTPCGHGLEATIALMKDTYSSSGQARGQKLDNIIVITIIFA